MAEAMASDEDRKSSSAQSPDTGSGKRVTSKSFKSFFRRKKKPASRMREHCLSVDEPEYQPRHHGAHYHTVSGTSSVGHVMHDQFSRRDHGNAALRMRRTAAHQGQTRSLTDSVSDDEDDDVTRPNITSSSSRRLPDYFRWRYKSAPDDADDDADQRSASRSASGTGGLAGGSRVRHWICSFKQRSRSNPASSASETPKSHGSKFKVTPARSLSTNAENLNHDVIGPVQFSEMVRNRTNSDPCFEAWLKAKAAVNSRQVGLSISFTCIDIYLYHISRIRACVN